MIGIIIYLLLLALLLYCLGMVLDSMGVGGRPKQIILLLVGIIGLLSIFGGWLPPMAPPRQAW